MQVSYASLLSAAPNATVTLETPEPGLMDVRVDLACGIVAEVYSVPSPEDETHRIAFPGISAVAELICRPLVRGNQ